MAVPAAAALGDGRSFDAHLEAGETYLERSGMTHPDLLHVLERATALGARAWVQKPVEVDWLIATLQRSIRA